MIFPRGTKGPKRKKMVIEAVIEKEKTPTGLKKEWRRLLVELCLRGEEKREESA